MACNKQSLAGYLKDFSGQRPLDAIICPFAGENGAGAGPEVFGLVVIGVIGMALAIRTRHPAPIVISGILSAGLFASLLPAGAATIYAIVLLAGLVAAGLFALRRFRGTL